MIDTTNPEKTSTAQEAQAQARQIYRDNLANGIKLTGAELGSMFDRRERWGQLRINEVDEVARQSSPVLPSAMGAPSLPPVTPPHADSADDAEEGGSLLSKWKARKVRKRETRATRGAERRSPEPRTVAVRAVPRPLRPQRRGASAVAWLAFGLGIVISVSANVGHIWFVTQPEAEAMWSAMVFAAFWPVALAVAVEVLARVTWPRGWRWPGLAGTVLVGGVALVVSYRHMNGLLLYFGESELSAALGPIGVDGLLIVGGFALLAIGETKKVTR